MHADLPHSITNFDVAIQTLSGYGEEALRMRRWAIENAEGYGLSENMRALNEVCADTVVIRLAHELKPDPSIPQYFLIWLYSHLNEWVQGYVMEYSNNGERIPALSEIAEGWHRHALGEWKWRGW